MGPLNGLKILDMTSVLMGPSATQMLGDMGADVIKVEAPDGDLIRQIGPMRSEGMGSIFLNANRSKRSIVIDLKQPEGRQALLQLAAQADVLVYNVRPAAMARLGLSYEEVAAANPRIIYAGLYGFGQDGPYAAKPAYDDLIQGAATLPYLFARANGGEPRYVPNAIADRVVGLSAVGAILAAVVSRLQTGVGQRVDVPMLETMVSVVMADHMGGLTFEPPMDDGGYARQLSPERRPYRTRDGYICAMVYNDKQWRSFLQAIGREALLEEDHRFRDFATRAAHIDHVYGELSRIFETRSTQEWIALLDAADIPSMPMHDLQSVLEDPHLRQVGFFPVVEHPSEGPIRWMRMPSTWSGTPALPTRHVPRLGEHTREVLAGAGFNAQEIDALLTSGAVRQEAAEGRDAEAVA
ncbi:CaiB/BaiF CoA transferase family protein [Cupriavidus necator]